MLSSKLAIVGPASVPDADVDYTFGQVSMEAPFADYKGNCGNISAAVGPFAIDEGLVDALGKDLVTVRIHNTNTGSVLRATVPVLQGRAQVDGDERVAGVPGSAARVDLDFSATQGSVTGLLLPTGLRSEVLQVPDNDAPWQSFEVTLIDAGQAMVFLKAYALGISSDPRRAADQIENDLVLRRRIERIRGAAAVRMRIVERWQDAERTSPYTPFLAALASPLDDSYDLGSVCVFMQQVHKAYPVTGSVATMAAAFLPGTLPHLLSSSTGGRLRIGHPSGVMEVHGSIRDDAIPKLLQASITRTARRLMDGHAYIPWSVWPRESPSCAGPK